MSEKTIDFPRRARRVQQITGALAAIPSAGPNMPPLLRETHRITDQAFLDLPEEEKLLLFRTLRSQLLTQQQRYTSLLKISSALSATLDRREFLEMTLEHITEVMQAERSTLYLVESSSGRLHGLIAQGTGTSIILNPGQGIAGWVADSGQSLNINNAYDDPRFNSAIDNKTGFQTHSMLCQPLKNADGEIIAVLQVLNSVTGLFTEEDENLLSAIGGQIAIALENRALYQSLLLKNEALLSATAQLEYKVAELDLLYDIQRDVSQRSDLESLVQTITRKTLELINGKACAVSLRDGSMHRVHMMRDRSLDYSRDWEFYTRMVDGKNTITAQVIQTREPFICRSGACREIPGPAGDTCGASIENVIAVPLFDDNFDDKECIGSLQVFDLALPHDPNELGFTEDDIKVLTLIGSQISSTLASRRRREQQEKEDRLATIGQMIAGILHDFKTPFSVISGYVQIMADTEESELRREYAGRVVKQFKELNQMTRELLKFARGDSRILTRKTLLSRYISEIEELLQTEFSDYKIDLEVSLDYRGEVHFDPVKIKRAILNLARNARDAMPEGGTFRLRVARKDPDLLELRFSDTGVGIPFEIRDQLFESFVTLGKPEGTGIGLAVVKKIVEDHQGQITFTTELEQGTEFVITLPLLPPAKELPPVQDVLPEQELLPEKEGQ